MNIWASLSAHIQRGIIFQKIWTYEHLETTSYWYSMKDFFFRKYKYVWIFVLYSMRNSLYLYIYIYIYIYVHVYLLLYFLFWNLKRLFGGWISGLVFVYVFCTRVFAIVFHFWDLQRLFGERILELVSRETCDLKDWNNSTACSEMEKYFECSKSIQVFQEYFQWTKNILSVPRIFWEHYSV